MNSVDCTENATASSTVPPATTISSTSKEAVKPSDNTTTTTSTAQPTPTNNSSPTDSEPSSSSAGDTTLPALHWLVKPCFTYDEEYSDCRSFKARFHQYFIHGESVDCSQWKKDYDNCNLWEKKKDHEALKNVIEGEKSRIRTRLQGHYANDVWENRKEPPKDWSDELPQEIQQEYVKSFLKEKADALKEGTETLGNVDKNIREAGLFDVDEATRCVIV